MLTIVYPEYGKNIVQYDEFDWYFLQTEHFPIADYLPYCAWQYQYFSMIQKDKPGEVWWEEKIKDPWHKWKSGEDAWK